MQFKILTTTFLISISTSSFAHFVYVPKSIEQILPKNQSVISIDYGQYSKNLRNDAVIITIDQINEKEITDNFENLYKYQRYVYILSQTNGQWKTISQNLTLLKPKALPDGIHKSDEVDFRNAYENNKRSTAFIAITPIGYDQDFPDSNSTFSISYLLKDQKSYITEESHDYDDPLSQNRYCGISKEYQNNEYEFSRFASHQRELVLPLINKKECAN